MNSEDTILFAHWEAFWFTAKEIYLHPFYHPQFESIPEWLDYELTQCISFLFWPSMIMPDDN